MNLPAEEGISILQQAHEEHEDNKLYLAWVSIFPKMTEETFVSFSEYKEQCRTAAVPKKSKDQIMNETEALFKSLGF